MGIVKYLDKDGDGMLSIEEIMQEGDEDFSEEDREPLERIFKQADEDGDGKMSLAELPAMMKMFNEEQGQEDDEAEPDEQEMSGGRHAWSDLEVSWLVGLVCANSASCVFL